MLQSNIILSSIFFCRYIYISWLYFLFRNIWKKGIYLHNDTALVRAMGDVSDRIGRPTDNGQVIVLTFYELIRCAFFFFVCFCRVPSNIISLWLIQLIGSSVLLQIGIIDPDCRLIGLHLYDGLFKVWIQLTWHMPLLFGWENGAVKPSINLCNFGQVIPFDNKGQLKEAFNIRYLSFFCATPS